MKEMTGFFRSGRDEFTVISKKGEKDEREKEGGGANGGYEEVREEALIVLALSQGQ